MRLQPALPEDLNYALFRCTLKVKIFSLSLRYINLWIMHEVVNVDKKITNYTV
jgi:hypothetical protein